MAVMQPKSSMPLVGAFAVALLLLSQATPHSNVLEYMQAKPELRSTYAWFSTLPYIMRMLANPKFVGTLFLPVDKPVQTLYDSLPVEGCVQPEQLDTADFDNRFTWQGISLQIVPNVTLTAAQLKKGMKLTNLLADTMQQPITVVSKGPTILSSRYRKDGGDVWLGDVAQVLSSVRVTKNVMVHLVNATFYPENAPFDTYEPFCDWCGNDAWFALVNASSYRSLFAGPWEPWREPRMTVFEPTPEAIQAYLNTSKQTLAALLTNQSATDHFVGAHVAPTMRLWAWDLMNLASQRYGGSFGTLAGTRVRAVTDYSKVWLVGPSGVAAEVRAPVDPGGNSGGCASSINPVEHDCQDYPVVGQELHGVLL